MGFFTPAVGMSVLAAARRAESPPMFRTVHIGMPEPVRGLREALKVRPAPDLRVGTGTRGGSGSYPVPRSRR